MKPTLLPLALPAPAQPHDRAIWIIANVICRDEISTWVDRYEGYAEWCERSQDWLDARGMSIRQDYDAELRILEWRELKDRAAEATEEETYIGGNVYFWNDEWRREAGKAGWFALCHMNHEPTRIQLAALDAGPFATRAQALGELTVLLTKITSREARRIA